MDEATDSEVRSRVYAALQRAGIQLPYPQYHIHLTNKDDKYEQNKRLRRIKERMDALQQVELFNTLHDDELAEIAERLVYTPFVQGDMHHAPRRDSALALYHHQRRLPTYSWNCRMADAGGSIAFIADAF